MLRAMIFFVVLAEYADRMELEKTIFFNASLVEFLLWMYQTFWILKVSDIVGHFN